MSICLALWLCGSVMYNDICTCSGHNPEIQGNVPNNGKRGTFLDEGALIVRVLSLTALNYSTRFFYKKLSERVRAKSFLNFRAFKG